MLTNFSESESLFDHTPRGLQRFNVNIVAARPLDFKHASSPTETISIWWFKYSALPEKADDFWMA